MKEEIKSAFFSKRFLLAFGLMMTCFLGYSLPSWIFSADWGDEFREGALQLSVGGIFFGSSMLLLPFCASVPYAISQVDEIRTSFLEWKVLRGSIRRYSFNKIVATMLSAAVATSMAFALHAACLEFYRFIPMIWLHIRIRKFHLVQTAFIRIGQIFFMDFRFISR